MSRELVELVEHHAFDAAETPYARLGVLPPARAEAFHRRELRDLLSSPEASGVRVQGGGMPVQALAIATPREADSRALGVRIGEMTWLSVDARCEGAVRRRALAELFAECRLAWRDRFDLVTALVDLDRTDELEGLQAHRARIHGANVTWVARLARVPGEAVAHPMTRRAELWEGPLEPLLDCVRASFARYRSHYHADSRLDPSRASESYVAAVERHHASGGQTVVVVRDGVIEGFSTLDSHEAINAATESNLVGEIQLSGVSPSARTPGIYEITLRRALAWYCEQNYRFIVFGCKADNLVVQRVWARLGEFAPRRVRQRLHWWLH